MSTDYYEHRVLRRGRRSLRVQVVTSYDDYAGTLPRPHNPAYFFTMLVEGYPDLENYLDFETKLYDDGPSWGRHFVREVRCVELRNLFRPMKYGFYHPADDAPPDMDGVPYGIYDVDYHEELYRVPREERGDLLDDEEIEALDALYDEITMEDVLGLAPGFIASKATESWAGVWLPDDERRRLEAIVTPDALKAALQPGAAVPAALLDAAIALLGGGFSYHPPVCSLVYRALAPGDDRHVADLARATSNPSADERLLARTFSPEGHPALLIGWAEAAQWNMRYERHGGLIAPEALPNVCEIAAGVGMSPSAAGWVIDNLRERLPQPLHDPERIALLFALRRHGAPEGGGFWGAFPGWPLDDRALRRAWLWMLAGLEPDEAAASAGALRRVLADLLASPEAPDLRLDLALLLRQQPGLAALARPALDAIP